MIIRPATPADAPAIVALINPIIALGTMTAYTTPFTNAAQREYLERFPQAGVFNLAVDGEDLLGWQEIVPTDVPGEAEIATFVRLDQHGRGVGSALMRASTATMRERGFRTIIAEIRADSPVSQAYYIRHGFSETARYDRLADDGRVMPKILRTLLLRP